MPKVRLRIRLSILGGASLLAMIAYPIACLAQSTTAPAETESDPVAYLNRALDEIQTHALRRGSVNWPRIRAEALACVSHAGSTVDTYGAIRFALASLGDHHSSLHLTPAQQVIESHRNKNESCGEQQLESSPAGLSPYVGRYEPDGQIEQFGGKPFALVVVPKCFPQNDKQFVQFETKLQRIVADLDKSHPLGWIVDLRGNVGGNMWPMLAGIGPVLGEGDHLGEFFDTDGHAVWRYRNGIAGESENGKVTSYPAVAGTPYKLASKPNVAVLIDRSTGSSGEAVAIAFRSRPKTRFFGEHTEGVSTVNAVLPLSDGASLWLTVGVQADRHGKQYLDGFAPDEVVDGGDKALPPTQDPVVQAALRWLSRLAPK